MKQKNIIVPKTARYFILGEPSEQTETVWFVCHGYGQLANYFIRHFHALDTARNLVIAPEGLHRFYWERFSGRVVASWMTKEDRTSDIRDYVTYLDAVYKEVMNSLPHKNVKVNVLGFSQGTATVCRWLANGASRADMLLLWAGVFPPDMDFDAGKEVFGRMRICLVLGDKDEFLSEEELRKQEQFLTGKGMSYELLRFEGGHEIHRETLLQLAGS